jgi:hypothetical protein
MVFLFALVLVLALGLTTTADADLYTYRDRRGHIHLTNQFSSIPPEYRDQALRSSRPESGLSPALSPQMHEPSQPSATPQPVPSAPATSRRESTPRQAQPVSTTQFASIRSGMREAEVLRRLGSPARTEDAPNTRVGTNTIRNGVLISRSKEVEHYNWIYPAGKGMPATVIRFADGEVTDIYRIR